MKAMVLAAGLGTRLRPLTGDRPKALVEVAGRTLLEITLERLRGFGICEVIINVHHFGEMVVQYLKAHGDFGMRIEISREELLLDTGGGLKKAAEFFLRDGDLRDGLLRHADDEPFVLHNVDVLSSMDLGAMARFHREQGALATLAVRQRKSSRRLLFDGQLELCGRRTGEEEAEMARPAEQVQELAFSGIHIVSPRIFSLLSEEHEFPIIPAYLRLAAAGERIMGFRDDASYWRDLGTVASLQQAAADIAQGALGCGGR
jgi:NDP-sugar pyrophosphorylase family protein